jgi:hypothetical protein
MFVLFEVVGVDPLHNLERLQGRQEPGSTGANGKVRRKGTYMLYVQQDVMLVGIDTGRKKQKQMKTYKKGKKFLLHLHSFQRLRPEVEFTIVPTGKSGTEFIIILRPEFDNIRFQSPLRTSHFSLRSSHCILHATHFTLHFANDSCGEILYRNCFSQGHATAFPLLSWEKSLGFRGPS